jgi:hypothetical protein
LYEILKLPEKDQTEKNSLIVKLIGVFTFIIQFSFNNFLDFLESEESKSFFKVISFYLKEGEQCVQNHISEFIKFVIESFTQRMEPISPGIFTSLLPELHIEATSRKLTSQYYRFLEQYIDILSIAIKNDSK